MPIYKGSTNQGLIYYGSPNTNCLTSVPKNVNLALDPLNVDIVGSPTINDGVVSGFSGSNWLRLPTIFNPSSNAWEMVIKARTPSAFSKRNWLTGGGNAAGKDFDFVSIGLESNGKPLMYITSNGTSWNIASAAISSNTLEVNTDYLFRFQFTGTQYIYSTSVDNGSNWITQVTINSTTSIFVPTTPQAIGTTCYTANAPEFWSGSIDLPNSYIKINGSTWWRGGTGALTLKAGSKVYVPNGFEDATYYKRNVTVVGSPTINNGVVSGFSSSNYLKINKTFSPGSSSWEIWFQFATSGTFNDNKVIFDASSGSHSVVRAITIYITPSMKMAVGLSGTAGSSWTIKNETDVNNFTFASNKVYVYKLSFNGSIYKGEVYDGESGTWTTDFTVASSSTVYSSSSLIIGQWIGFSANTGFASLIDISGSYIKINGSVWWQGVTESTDTDYDYMVGTIPKFDVVTIESDRTLTRTINGTYFVTANIVGGTNITDVRLVSSGANPTPASYSLQYNTTSNEIKRYSDSTSSYTKDSFPVAIVTVSNSSISSIDQIFDWCGFIGSTAFVLPGVKGLIPNGFNANGSYRSIEFTTDRVFTTTRTWDEPASFIQKLFIYNRGKALGIQSYQIESDSMPTVNDWTVWYNPKENIQRWNNSSNTLTDISQWTVDTTMRYIGEIPSDGTSKIVSLVPTTVQPLSTGIAISNIYKGSTLVYENKLPAGQIVFEQAAAGTYTVTLPKTQNYRLIMVGGGGGGASGGSGHYTNYNAGGGSGGYVEVIVKLNKGSYTVSVGAIGAHGAGSSAGLYYGTAGGNTTAFGFTAGGGQGGRCSIHSGGPLGGAGGSNTLATYVQLVANTTGNTGATSGGSYNVSGGASVYGSYGRGQNAYGDAGVAGYIKIVTA